MTDEIQTRGAPVTGLLPCPFCGGEAVDRREIDGFPMIYCDGEECFGPQTTAKTFQDALVQWNTRLPGPAQSPDLRGAAPFCKLRGFRGSKLCIDGCEQAGKCLRDPAMTSPSQPTSPSVDGETLIHTICPHIKQWSDGDDTVDHTCQKCPATVQTSQGEGVQMCRLNAQRCAEAVRALSSLSEAPVAGEHRARQDALEEAARIADNGCLAPPDGGSPTDDEREMCEGIASAIRARKLRGAEGVFAAPSPDTRVREALENIAARCTEHIKAAREHGGASPIIGEIRDMALAALPQPGAVEPDAGTVQTLLDLLNPLHGELDRQTYDEKVRDEFDAPRDKEYSVNVTGQMESDLTQAVLILEDRKRGAPKSPALDPATLEASIERIRDIADCERYDLSIGAKLALAGVRDVLRRTLLGSGASNADTSTVPTCSHPAVHYGPAKEARWGKVPTQICDHCGAWRTMHHTQGPWRTDEPVSQTMRGQS